MRRASIPTLCLVLLCAGAAAPGALAVSLEDVLEQILAHDEQLHSIEATYSVILPREKDPSFSPMTKWGWEAGKQYMASYCAFPPDHYTQDRKSVV